MLFRETPQNVPKHPPVMLSWALLIVAVVFLCVSLALFLADRNGRQTAQGSVQTVTSTAKPSVSPSPDRSSNTQLPGTGPNGTVPGSQAFGGSACSGVPGGGQAAAGPANGQSIDPAGLTLTVSGTPSLGGDGLGSLLHPSLPGVGQLPPVPTSTPLPLP
jgi:hypothetical protein